MITRNICLATIAILTLSANLLVAQTGYAVKSAKMTVSGTSTLHPWESNVTKVMADGKISIADGALQQISSLTVTVPARSIKSEHGKMMDDKTYDALKADANPNITFQLVSVDAIEKSGSGYTVKAKGNLTIAGVKKLVSMTVTSTVAANGNVTFKGSKLINTKEFGMETVKALMGTVKVGDEVTINFEVTLGPASAS